MTLNNKGIGPMIVPVGAVLVAALTLLLGAHGIENNARSGKLTRDKKLIWCKMQGIDKTVCEENYPWPQQ